MPSFETNPFTVLSLIAAPAVLTNASSVLALGTSNRFARAIDRARALSTEINSGELPPRFEEVRLRQLDRAERRSILLARAMASFYLGVGCFASASLVSLLGAGVAATGLNLISRLLQLLAVMVGVVGVSGIVHGCYLLLQESRLVILNLQEESEYVHARRQERLAKPSTDAGPNQ
jgi:hypothetical protein